MSNYSSTFLDLTPQQQCDVARKARSWYNDHKTHIDSMVDIRTRAVIPTAENSLLGPQTWTPENWVWFFDSNI